VHARYAAVPDAGTREVAWHTETDGESYWFVPVRDVGRCAPEWRAAARLGAGEQAGGDT